MSKEQTFSEKYPQIWGEIEREYPLKRFMSSYEKAERRISINSALRGAEIALENQWIRVEEGLPEEEREYPVYTSNYGFAVASYSKSLGFNDAYGVLDIKVTHYLITPPPKP